jgi:hypothetical protein
MSSAYSKITPLVESQAGAYITINEALQKLSTTRLVKSITTNVTLTEAEAANDIIEFNGTLTADATITFPIHQKDYTIVNNTTGGFTLKLKISGGSEIFLENTRKTIIYCNGANLLPAIDSFPYGIQIGGTVKLPIYSVASAPVATAYYGNLIFVTNGDSGSPCLAVSDGGTWKRIALGATIA